MEKIVLKSSENEGKRKDTNWGSLTWLASSEIGNADDLTVGRVVIKKGMSNPRHIHPNCEEILYLLKGKLDHSVGDDSHVLEAGDTISVKANIPHHADNIGNEDADMIVIYSSAERGFELE